MRRSSKREKIKITFQSGKSLFVHLNEDSRTAREIYKMLPFKSEAVHSRWSGREINAELPIDQKIPPEDQTIYTSLGEVCYWSNWRRGENEEQKHVIAIYYGAEMTRSKCGEEPVNVIGRVKECDIETLTELGEMIWLKGAQKMYMERA